MRAEIAELLEFSGLAHKQDELAANLAFGEQRRLELARALAARPKLLLLDEPAAGMNSEEIGQLRERILKLRAQGITIVLIEHVMELVMGVTDRIAVLNFGQKIAEGTPARDPGRSAGAQGLPGRRDLMLRVQDLVTAYGKIEALKGVSLEVARGSITCLLGPNGAGKTTLMMTIAGVLKPKAGSISFSTTEISGLPPHDIVRAASRSCRRTGSCFPSMTVLENLHAGAYQRKDGIEEDIERVFEPLPAPEGALGAGRAARSRAASSRCSRWRAR